MNFVLREPARKVVQLESSQMPLGSGLPSGSEVYMAADAASRDDAGNWARFQSPPLLQNSPFHRFGVTIRAKAETRRDRRILPDEEHALLKAALEMDAEQHACVAMAMHDRIIGALETCCRQGEVLRILNRHVDWEHHQLAIPGAHAKDAEDRRVPFDPHGRLAPILKRQKALGPAAHVFGGLDGEFQGSFRTAWESVVLRAHGHDTVRTKTGGRVNREAPASSM